MKLGKGLLVLVMVWVAFSFAAQAFQLKVPANYPKPLEVKIPSWNLNPNYEIPRGYTTWEEVDEHLSSTYFTNGDLDTRIWKATTYKNIEEMERILRYSASAILLTPDVIWARANNVAQQNRLDVSWVKTQFEASIQKGVAVQVKLVSRLPNNTKLDKSIYSIVTTEQGDFKAYNGEITDVFYEEQIIEDKFVSLAIVRFRDLKWDNIGNRPFTFSISPMFLSYTENLYINWTPKADVQLFPVPYSKNPF